MAEPASSEPESDSEEPIGLVGSGELVLRSTKKLGWLVGAEAKAAEETMVTSTRNEEGLRLPSVLQKSTRQPQ